MVSLKTYSPPKALSYGMSALSILPNPTPSTWNPEQILYLYNYEIRRWSCLGLTNKSHRCRGDPMYHLRSRKSAVDVVLSSILPEALDEEDGVLEGLAHSNQCHEHRSEAATDDLVEGWKMVLQKARQKFKDQHYMEQPLQERQSNMGMERVRNRWILLPRLVSGAASRASIVEESSKYEKGGIVCQLSRVRILHRRRADYQAKPRPMGVFRLRRHPILLPLRRLSQAHQIPSITQLSRDPSS
ncbi:hypothetical protein B0T14DRAFT_505492 [Immersiella caudata]|uniref:Uncharacterized protein n=1 Tax=Immersiella caudata TaxID=314043 RepID=A0AA39XFC3_9PEZI|nr:hypothetical protein B0T14DRAFT_505492 [Immersiella caudata]